MKWRRWIAGILLAVSSLAPVHAQKLLPPIIQDRIWGFDGRVVPGHFTPYSILVDNPNEASIEVEIRLQRLEGGRGITGGTYTQSIFLGGNARRWVQFYPYIPNSFQEEWRLSVHDGEQFDDEELLVVPQPSISVPAGEDDDVSPQAVILDSETRPDRKPATVKHMPENIFPPYSGATFGLHTVFMDRSPDWEFSRQKSFMAWLKLGGQLYVLQDSRGEYPQFAGELAVLNQPLERFRLGAGTIFRRPYQRSELTKGMVAAAVAPKDRLPLNNPTTDVQSQIAASSYGDMLLDMGDTDGHFFEEMRELLLPEHNWAIIFLLALSYCALIFPGCFLLSRQRQWHYLSTYGAILGTAFVFSMIFLLVGRRGYGEKTTLQTMAIATSIEGDDWNVFQWNTFFVTSGDRYKASSVGDEAVYASGNVDKQVNMKINTGSDPELEMVIPPFASETFVTRRQLKVPFGRTSIESISIRPEGLDRLVLKPDADFSLEGIHKAWLMAGTRMYELRVDEPTATLQYYGTRKSIKNFIAPNYQYGVVNPFASVSYADKRSDAQIFLDESYSTLVRRHLSDSGVATLKRFRLQPDRIRLYVYRDVPEELSFDVNTQSRIAGRVLCVQDLILEEAKDAINAP